MNFIDYRNAVISDAEDVIAECFDNGTYDEETDFNDVYDNLFVDDAVTGNASGSYTFNSAQAKENIKDAVFDDDICESLEQIGIDAIQIGQYLGNNDYETLDVCIRCAVLGDVCGEIADYFHDCQSNCEA